MPTQAEIDKLKFPLKLTEEEEAAAAEAAKKKLEEQERKPDGGEGDNKPNPNDALNPDGSPKVTANDGNEDGGEFNAQTKIQELQKQLEQNQKNYDELRSKSTKDWQSSAERDRQFEALQASMGKLVEKFNQSAIEKEDPEQFMENLKTQGPKYLDKYITRHTDALKAKHEEDKQEGAKETSVLRYENAFMKISRDTKQYPGFEGLESKMNEIAASPDCPVNLQQPIPIVLKALYKLASTSSTDENLRKAKNLGAEQERIRLAKEAQTSVVGSGKSKSNSAVPNLYTMPLDKLRDSLPKSDLRDYD